MAAHARDPGMTETMTSGSPPGNEMTSAAARRSARTGSAARRRIHDHHRLGLDRQPVARRDAAERGDSVRRGPLRAPACRRRRHDHDPDRATGSGPCRPERQHRRDARLVACHELTATVQDDRAAHPGACRVVGRRDVLHRRSRWIATPRSTARAAGPAARSPGSAPERRRTARGTRRSGSERGNAPRSDEPRAGTRAPRRRSRTTRSTGSTSRPGGAGGPAGARAIQARVRRRGARERVAPADGRPSDRGARGSV